MKDCLTAEKQHGSNFSAPCNMTYIEWNFIYSSANFPTTREHGAPERAPHKLEAPLIDYGAPKQERIRQQDLLRFTFLRHIYTDA
jgi:hypothetical protein